MDQKEYIIRQFLEHLEMGHVILYPTDTIWGLGGDPFNAKAVQKVFQIKARPPEKSFILLADSMDMIESYIPDVPTEIKDLAAASADPLTIIYPNASAFPENVIHESGSIAIRIIRHEWITPVITRFGKPIISTSANLSGQPSPAYLQDVVEDILLLVDFIVPEICDISEYRKPSLLVKIEENGELTWLRK